VRSHSQGETSRSALDAMAHGLPLIVNVLGTMKELPDDCVIKLPEAFTDADLTKALERLWQDETTRRNLGRRGREHISKNHAPYAIGKKYRDAIEFFASHSDRARYFELISHIIKDRGCVKPTESDLATVAACVGANLPRTRSLQLLLDVTDLIREQDVTNDLSQSTHRILGRLLHNSSVGLRVEPVYRVTDRYRYARAFTCNYLGLENIGLDDELIDVKRGDSILVIGKPESSPESQLALTRLQALGATVYFFIQAAPDTHLLNMICSFADGVVCASPAAAEDLDQLINQQCPKQTVPLKIGFFDIDQMTVAETPPTELPWRWH
jgi:hypothetical protein